MWQPGNDVHVEAQHFSHVRTTHCCLHACPGAGGLFYTHARYMDICTRTPGASTIANGTRYGTLPPGLLCSGVVKHGDGDLLPISLVSQDSPTVPAVG